MNRKPLITLRPFGKFATEPSIFPEERRYVERSGSERVNGRLKDEFGGRHVRVRGYDKVLAHLMFGMTVLTASQLMRLIVPPI